MKSVTAYWIAQQANLREITATVVTHQDEHAVMLYAGSGPQLLRLVAICGLEWAYNHSLAPVEEQLSIVMERDLKKLRWIEDEVGITIW